MAASTEPTVTAVVLAWKEEPWLIRCVEALLASTGVQVDVVLVDNGCTTDDVTTLAEYPRVTVVRPDGNLGYAGGNNAGAQHATGEYLALVNGDLIVRAGAVRSLVDVLRDPDVGLAVASVRLGDNPELINAGANPVHILGVSWSGNMGQPERHTEPIETTAASGACVLTRTAHWRNLDGFDDQYFAYHEDTDLSLRTWRLGMRVLYVPDAVGLHRYEFSRNALKMYLVERNRLLVVLTLWSTRALILLAPAFVTLEAATLALAVKQGWIREKIRGWVWLWHHRQHIRTRRAYLRTERHVPNREWMRHLTPAFDATFFPLPIGRGMINAVIGLYWKLARHLV